MKYRELKLKINKDIVDSFTSFLEENNITNYYEVLLDLEAPKSSNQIISNDTLLYIFLDLEVPQDELKVIIYLNTYNPELYFLESRTIESKEYEEAFKEFYKPFVVGKSILLVPVWEKEQIEIKNRLSSENLKPMYLDPGLAFGTGHHETTKMMISRMEEVIRPEMKVVDMGCGSGILTIASFILGCKEAISIDIDNNAVNATSYNLEFNFSGYKGNQCKIFSGGFDHPILKDYTFDILLANITLSVISNNIDFISKYHTNRYLFSGFLKEKREVLIDLLKNKVGGEPVFELELNDWMVLEWKR